MSKGQKLIDLIVKDSIKKRPRLSFRKERIAVRKIFRNDSLVVMREYRSLTQRLGY